MNNTILQFINESEYLKWESQQGNCIYALQDTLGRYIGDIKESDLVPLWDTKRIVSFDNPTDDKEQSIIDDMQNNPMYEGTTCNWAITNDNDKEIFTKLIKIKY